MRILERVTLCCIDTAHHELALAALHQCLAKCRFARVLFITDRDYALEGVECARIPPLDSRDAYSQFVIKELWRYLDTDFVLLVQWDGFVVNADAWSDEFLSYDYIGAKWTFHDDEHTVGNGGFSLRSKRLLDALRDPHVEVEPLEDVAICRTYRTYLEATHAIRFAPEAVADRFSFEASYFQSLPFGFHGLFNFWMFLAKDGLARFLAMATPSILGSVQCLRLAKNYAELGRREEAAMVLRAILAAHPAASEARNILTVLESGVGARSVAAVGRNAPCPCGSGKRYKDCHGRIEATKP
jgi:hypothetical protein